MSPVVVLAILSGLIGSTASVSALRRMTPETRSTTLVLLKVFFIFGLMFLGALVQSVWQNS